MRKRLLYTVAALIGLVISNAPRLQAQPAVDVLSGYWEGSLYCNDTAMRPRSVAITKDNGNTILKFGYPFKGSKGISLANNGDIRFDPATSNESEKPILQGAKFQSLYSKFFGSNILYARLRHKECPSIFFIKTNWREEEQQFGTRHICNNVSSWFLKDVKVTEQALKLADDNGLQVDAARWAGRTFMQSETFQKQFSGHFGHWQPSKQKAFLYKVAKCFATNPGGVGFPIDYTYFLRMGGKYLFTENYVDTAIKHFSGDPVDRIEALSLDPSENALSLLNKESSDVATTLLLDVEKTLKNSPRESLKHNILSNLKGRLEHFPMAAFSDLFKDNGLLDSLLQAENNSRRSQVQKFVNMVSSQIQTLKKNPLTSIEPPNEGKFLRILPKPGEFEIGSHFGVRHFVREDVDCSAPNIRTAAMTDIDPSMFSEVYFGSILRLRKYCFTSDTGDLRFDALPLTVNAEWFVGETKIKSFQLQIGGAVRAEGFKLEVEHLTKLHEGIASHPLASAYWIHQQEISDLAAVLPKGNFPSLAPDIYYSRAVAAESNSTRSSPANFEMRLLDQYGRPNLNYVARSVVDNKMLKAAADLQHVEAVRFLLKSKYPDAFIGVPSSADQRAVGDYVKVTHDLYQARDFLALQRLKVLKTAGFDAIDAVRHGDLGKLRLIDQQPSRPQMKDALVSLFKQGDCSQFGLLFLGTNSKQEWATILSDIVFDWSETGCRTGVDGANMLIKLTGVASASCDRTPGGYECEIVPETNCIGVLPGQSTLDNKTLPLRQAKQMVCAPFTGSNYRSSRWRFLKSVSEHAANDHVSIFSWLINEANNPPAFKWIAQPAKGK